MKKYLMLLGLAAALFTACKDDEETASELIEHPYYFDWDVAFLHTTEIPSVKTYTRLFYNSDSLIFRDDCTFSNGSKDTYLTRFSTHNNVFKGKDPDVMSESEVVELAKDWIAELKKEPDLDAWIKHLAKLHSQDFVNGKHPDYGLLWGFDPVSFNTSSDFLYINFNDYSLCYHTTYVRVYQGTAKVWESDFTK